MRKLEAVFKALGDTNRLRIVNLLLHGELCVCDIQYVLQNSQPNISRHLTYLKRSEMVLDRREGSRIFYRLADAKDLGKKPLYDFLRGSFAAESQLQQDTARLQEAVANGSCTLSVWKPFSAKKQSEKYCPSSFKDRRANKSHGLIEILVVTTGLKCAPETPPKPTIKATSAAPVAACWQGEPARRCHPQDARP